MTMSSKTIESAAESLYGDERLRSNLTDKEAKVILDWAVRQMEARAKAMSADANAPKMISPAEFDRVREVVMAINAAARKPDHRPLAQLVAEIVPTLTDSKVLTREEVNSLVKVLAQEK